MRRILVPLGVIALAIAVFQYTRQSGTGPVIEFADDVDACKENLRAIYGGLRDYAREKGNAPQTSGVAFFGGLVASGVLPPGNARILTCPGAQAAEPAAGVDFTSLEALDGNSSAYSGRDSSAFPLAKFPSGGAELEALVACDNAEGMNHDGMTNVLYSDGSIRTYELAQLIDQGKVPAESTNLLVGPESPLEDLQKLVP